MVFEFPSTPRCSMTPPSRASPLANHTKSVSTLPNTMIFPLVASSAFFRLALYLSPQGTRLSWSALCPSTPTGSTPKSTARRPSPSVPPSTRSEPMFRATAPATNSPPHRLLWRTAPARLLKLSKLPLTALLRRWRSTSRHLTLLLDQP